MKYLKKSLLIILAIYSSFFCITAILVPLFAYSGNYKLSAELSYLLSNACHQSPDRSFWLLGYPVSLCARCLGVYIGVTVTCFFALADKININLKLFTLLAFICITDISLNLFHINTGNITRLCIGLIIGFLITITVNFILNIRRKNYEN